MSDDSKLYRERAEAEPTEADNATLPNIRIRALRSDQRWEEMAQRAERVPQLRMFLSPSDLGPVDIVG